MGAAPKNEEELEELLSAPSVRLVDFMKKLEGDIMLLGAAGKVGVTLGMMAARAAKSSGKARKVYAVSRFGDAAARARLDAAGVTTIACDLIDREAVAKLPEAHNVIFLAGKKFGTSGAQDQTWAMNTVVPANVADHFKGSRIVVFSTGCVYPLAAPDSGGSIETDDPEPVGEYAQSALGRERVFEYFSRTKNMPVCLFRLNYAIDLRYGVLHDLALKVRDGEPIDLAAGTFNCIWQGDVIERAILALDLCAVPPYALNVTGPETISVRWAAEELGRRLGRVPAFVNTERSCDPVYLSNAALSFSLFGYPRVALSAMMDMTAEWVVAGGSSLGKPTHFERRDGKY
ncbi:MAG: NAD(P)-dependent oxidoreductase [Rectinemataceae bacterium]|nr:NAD(P)-dependent oxidoreductase [Rectinemataceae bacterium]